MTHYNKGALVYIEPYYDDKFNEAIVDNHRFITDIFNHNGIPFVYLPLLLTDLHINKVLEYNHPYLKDAHQIHPGKLYYVITQNLRLKIDGPTLIFFSDQGKVLHQYALPSHEVFTEPERLFLFVENIKTEIESTIEDKQPPIEDNSPSIRFRMGDESKSVAFDSMFDSIFDEISESKTVKSYEKPTSTDLFKKESTQKTADDLFEEQAFTISPDLEKQIETLSEAGYLSHLIKYLEILQETTRTLSRLKITDDYRLYLMDYEMKEVVMSPLPKALFFLFLNHPDGITFKELPDYRAELMNIYQNISLRENYFKVKSSIKKLTDPFDNSVHEKCSRIRAAFLAVVAEDIAMNYYITGDRGEAKTIVLNRELVIYDKQTTLQGLQNSQ